MPVTCAGGKAEEHISTVPGQGAAGLHEDGPADMDAVQPRVGAPHARADSGHGPECPPQWQAGVQDMQEWPRRADGRAHCAGVRMPDSHSAAVPLSHG